MPKCSAAYSVLNFPETNGVERENGVEDSPFSLGRTAATSEVAPQAVSLFTRTIPLRLNLPED